jgi:carboxylate-amine ligase
MNDDWLRLGIEEEFEIVGRDGRLVSHIETLLQRAEPELGKQLKPEMLQSMAETGTRICSNVQDARAELLRLRRAIVAHLEPDDARIACAGTHPSADWAEQRVTDKERYRELEENMQDVVRNILIFALHIHVAIPDPDERIRVMNEVRGYLPRLLALSTSSPFWRGRNTGLKSYRSVIWSRLPRTGIPPEFSSADEFQGFVDLLVRSAAIDEGTKIWWDIRPHVVHPTLEFRICDATTRVEETLCIAALAQALCAKVLQEGHRRSYPGHWGILLHENKFRVMRYGLDATLFDFEAEEEMPVRDGIKRMVEYVDDVVDELGSRAEVEYVERILEHGTSADRQLRVYEESGDLGQVVEHLVEETMSGVLV